MTYKQLLQNTDYWENSISETRAVNQTSGQSSGESHIESIREIGTTVYYNVPWDQTSIYPKQDLDPLSRVCTVSPHEDRLTDIQTCICLGSLMWLKFKQTSNMSSTKWSSAELNLGMPSISGGPQLFRHIRIYTNFYEEDMKLVRCVLRTEITSKLLHRDWIHNVDWCRAKL